MFKRLLYRLVRGFTTGAVGAMSGVSIVAPDTWFQLGTLLNALLLVGLVGGIGGGLLAADLYLRNLPE